MDAEGRGGEGREGGRGGGKRLLRRALQLYGNLTLMSPRTFRAASSSLAPREKSGPGSHYIQGNPTLVRLKLVMLMVSYPGEDVAHGLGVRLVTDEVILLAKSPANVSERLHHLPVGLRTEEH